MPRSFLFDFNDPTSILKPISKDVYIFKKSHFIRELLLFQEGKNRCIKVKCQYCSKYLFILLK